jgi:hypothetical protein
MIRIRNIRVYSTDRDAITVTWEVADTVEDVSTYTVSVLRSQSATGMYNQVSLDMNAEDVFRFDDRGANILSKWREFYYRVKVTKVGGAEEQEYGSTPPEEVLQGKDPGGVTMGALPDLEALEAIRRFGLVLQEYSGRTVLLLKERTWGQRCLQCWDSLKRRVSRSDCQTCFRTGFSGGYFPPTEVRMLKPPHQEVVALTSLVELQPNDVIMWFNADPHIKPRDLVVDTEMRRWRAINIRRSEKSQALTRQTVQMRLISRDQIEYKIPVRGWTRDNVTAAAHRQYIRATDVDSYRTAAQELGLGEIKPNQIEGFPTTPEDA